MAAVGEAIRRRKRDRRIPLDVAQHGQQRLVPLDQERLDVASVDLDRGCADAGGDSPRRHFAFTS